MSSKRSACLPRMLVLFALAMVLAGVLPATAALPRQSGTVDIYVDADSIKVDPAHPEVGEMVKISASVWNDGYDTSIVDALFWDGNPSEGGRYIDGDQQAIDAQDTATFSANWDT